MSLARIEKEGGVSELYGLVGSGFFPWVTKDSHVVTLSFILAKKQYFVLIVYPPNTTVDTQFFFRLVVAQGLGVSGQAVGGPFLLPPNCSQLPPGTQGATVPAPPSIWLWGETQSKGQSLGQETGGLTPVPIALLHDPPKLFNPSGLRFPRSLPRNRVEADM